MSGWRRLWQARASDRAGHKIDERWKQEWWILWIIFVMEQVEEPTRLGEWAADGILMPEASVPVIR